jgi:DNA-binding CsgD family transcriptional regulator
MKVIVISDDKYFSFGIYASLESYCNVYTHDLNSAKLIDFECLNNALILMEINSGILFLEMICKINQLTNRVIVFTENNLCNSVKVASFYQLVNKRLSVLMLHEIANGSNGFNYSMFSLSVREKKILYLMLKGLTSNSISIELNISIKTVSAHRVNALKKLGLKKINQMGDLSKIYKLEV